MVEAGSRSVPTGGTLGLWIAITGILTSIGIVRAEEECLLSRIWCYECDTLYDYRCKDPFNSTAHPQDLPSLKRCEGCCVKIVMNLGMPTERVKRTCTSNLQINLFLVDHVCMLESDGKGLMCFCESDACNAVQPLKLLTSLILGSFLLLQLLNTKIFQNIA